MTGYTHHSMKFLEYGVNGGFAWRDGPEPELTSPLGALVRPLVVASCDLDTAVVDGRAPIPGPYPVGHEFVGEVISIGGEVESVAPGDIVSVPFQISCGTCARCRAGLTGNCTSVPARASYGLGLLGGLEWGGALADVIAVPYADSMAVRIPDSIDPHQVASLSDNLPDAFRTIGPYAAPGLPVLVVGGGSIGLYATALAVALGADVTYVDPDESRGRIAESMGAAVEQRRLDKPMPRRQHVIHTSGDPDQLGNALRSTDHGGVCFDTGIYFTGTVEVPLLDAYGIGLQLVTGRAHARRDMPAVLDLVVAGRVDPALVTTETVSWDDAADALQRPMTKLVMSRLM